MVISLSKGGSVSLSKEAGAAGLATVTVGLGWDVQAGAVFDLDASAIALASSGRAVSESELVFYNQLINPSGSVRHSGDNRTGEGDGDDEQIFVDLRSVPAAAQSIVFIVSIDAANQGQKTFGQVDNAFIRIVNDVDGRELARFDLSEGADSDVALAFGELYRDGAEWKFQAIGDGFPGGLGEALSHYGIDAA